MNNKLILLSIILTLSGVSLYSFAVNPKGYSSINIPKSIAFETDCSFLHICKM